MPFSNSLFQLKKLISQLLVLLYYLFKNFEILTRTFLNFHLLVAYNKVKGTLNKKPKLESLWRSVLVWTMPRGCYEAWCYLWKYWFSSNFVTIRSKLKKRSCRKSVYPKCYFVFLINWKTKFKTLYLDFAFTLIKKTKFK